MHFENNEAIMQPMLLAPVLPSSQKSLVYWGNLGGNSASFAIFTAALQHPGPVLVVAPDHVALNQLLLQLQFLQKDQIAQLPIYIFSDWETLPYDNFSPHPEIISDRLTTLSKLPLLSKGIVLITATTLMQRLPPVQYLQQQSFLLSKNEKINLTEIRLQLDKHGYRAVQQVYEHGEFAIRGSILDLFPMGSDTPYRIDLFDDEVESIRTFDPDTQLSIEQVDKIELLPAREFPFNENSIALFRQQWRTKFEGNPLNCTVYQDVSQGLSPAGIEYYLPLFYEQLSTLFEYLPSSTLIISHKNNFSKIDQFWREVKERFEQRRHDIYRPILAPTELYLPPQDLMAKINILPQIEWQAEAVTTGYNFAIEALPALKMEVKHPNPIQSLTDFLKSTKNKILFCAESAGRQVVFQELLNHHQIFPQRFDSLQAFTQSKENFGIIVAPLEVGFSLVEASLTIIPEAQLLGHKVVQARRSHRQIVDADAIIRNLSELQIGSPVVHIAHGVGRYQGLQTITAGGIETEFLTLEYAGGDKLYVPVAAMHLISRYSGVDNEHAPLHRLGNETWSKVRRKAQAQIRDVAAELLQIYAKRALKPGYQFNIDKNDYEKFANSFSFEETPDQHLAIENVLQDLNRAQAMDRLVCGDVGFGKTEVAMRAAFIAVQNGKQVVILVPTTLLAQQHHQSFSDRFADWPVTIESLSRFRSAKQQSEIIEKLKSGKVDIIIGTHRLIQKDVQFKNLGLMIVDEEHRFGVRQKDALKKMRAEVDILTLTATPIPRTLNMSLANVRDLSIIATPPARRLSIRTFVRERDNALIREAILREIMRGGQVYFLHNKVQTINKIAYELQQLIPEARIHIAHGQMHERELEKIMADFYHQKFNVLVCTTIIETGIDVPTANTIIMDQADHFGLAQLHQLRGRVGRSHHQAYAYLLISSYKSITKDAKKRLDAIASLEDLGAGFTLATHDLEIRGAGELLGEEQSGHMQEIGFSLYMDLLERAVQALKSGKHAPFDIEADAPVEVDLHIPTLLPEIYVPDISERLILYKRIASARDHDQLQQLQIELIDRFGLLPAQAKNLFSIMEIKLLAEKLGIKKIDQHRKGGKVEFLEKPNIDPQKIIKLIQSSPKTYQFAGANSLKFVHEEMPDQQRVTWLQDFLNRFLN